MLKDNKLCFLDCESTGLKKEIHEILEIAVLIYDPSTNEIIDEWERKIEPLKLETADPRALKLTNYINNPSLYKGQLKSALIKFNSSAKDCILVGQNIAKFDLPFIEQKISDFNIEPSFLRNRVLDTMSLAWFSVYATEIKGLKLDMLCDHFGVSNLGAHSALIDCRRTFELYQRLATHYGKNK